VDKSETVLFEEFHVPKHCHDKHREHVFISQPVQAFLREGVTDSVAPPGLIHEQAIKIAEVISFADGGTSNDLVITYGNKIFQYY
jgi:hypothetical protein